MSSSSTHCPHIHCRPATASDISLIAAAVSMAIGDESMRGYCGERYMEVLEEIVGRAETQYSYRNAFIAEVDGEPAGAIVGYNGAHLEAMRSCTLSIVERHTGRRPVIADETEAGEYYIDSLGVLPSFRNQGVGTQLLRHIIAAAFAAGHHRVGLIVDHDNPRAERVYHSIGFRRVGEKDFLGHPMWHMQIKP